MDSTTMHHHMGRKTLRKEKDLKIAHGHKADDHEEEQAHTWQQTMCRPAIFIARTGFGRKDFYEKFELYMETGMIGAYQPEMAVLKKVDDGVHPVYRDTVYELCEEGISGKRFMDVGDRRFRVTSVFPADASYAATQKFLSYIGSELSKESHSA